MVTVQYVHPIANDCFCWYLFVKTLLLLILALVFFSNTLGNVVKYPFYGRFIEEQSHNRL